LSPKKLADKFKLLKQIINYYEKVR
jgi:hypothetical protein